LSGAVAGLSGRQSHRNIDDDILREANGIAESCYGFIEADFTAADDPDWNW